jgi:hypothetical protein
MLQHRSVAAWKEQKFIKLPLLQNKTQTPTTKMPCLGKTPTNKPCRRKVAEGVDLCEHHRRKTIGTPTPTPPSDKEEEIPKTAAEEDVAFNLSIEDAPWWPGYIRWLDDHIRTITEQCIADYHTDYHVQPGSP